jgi:prepilin-type N-terminal cleavage/methylation domain-containing protein
MNTTQALILPRNPSSRRGFTLVELLVSITIIITLAALVFFITGTIRAKAQQANAMSSLRQLGTANIAFSSENNGGIMTLRWAGDPVLAGGGGWVSNTFWGRMHPYLFADIATNNQSQLNKEINARLDQLFNTPDADKMTNTFISGARIYHDTSGLPVPIAFNSNLHKWGKFLTISSFGDPSRVLYATYGFGFFNPEHGKSYVPLPYGSSTPIYYHKDKKALMLFLGGNVDMLSPPIPERLYE